MKLTTAIAAAFGGVLFGCRPAVAPPSVETCSALPILDNDLEPDAVTVPLRVENRMGPLFVVDAVCISIDGRRIRQDAPADIRAGLAAHRPLEMSVRLRPGVAHRVNVITTLVGRGPGEGYKFSVSAHRDLGPEDLKPETVAAAFVEKARERLEERPTVEWSGPGKSGIH